MAVEAASGSVVSHRCSRVGVAGRFLNIAEWNTGVEGRGDERMAETVRRDPLVDPGTLHQPLHHPIRAVAVHPTAFDTEEDRPIVRSPMYRSSARPVRGAMGMMTCLPPLRTIADVRWPRSVDKSSMSAFNASEIRSPFNTQQRDQRAVSKITEACLNEQRAEFVAVEAEGP